MVGGGVIDAVGVLVTVSLGSGDEGGAISAVPVAVAVDSGTEVSVGFGSSVGEVIGEVGSTVGAAVSVGTGVSLGRRVDVGAGGRTTGVDVNATRVGGASVGWVGKPALVAVGWGGVLITRGVVVNTIGPGVDVALASIDTASRTIAVAVLVGSRSSGSLTRLIGRPELSTGSGSVVGSMSPRASSGAVMVVASGRFASMSCPRPGITISTRKITTASDAATANIIGL